MCTRVSVIASETFKRLHDRAIEVGKKQRTIVGDDVYEITTNDKNTCMLFIYFTIILYIDVCAVAAVTIVVVTAVVVIGGRIVIAVFPVISITINK